MPVKAERILPASKTTPPNYLPKALKYSAGQHPAMIHIAMQLAALKQVNDWDQQKIQSHAKALTTSFVNELLEIGGSVEEDGFRANHSDGDNPASFN